MIRGSLVALVTPMNAAGEVDFPAIDALIDWHIAEGTNAIVAVGTTGESSTLDIEEHLAVISCVVSRAEGRVPVIAGTGSNSTREAIEQTRLAKEAGADACLLVTPYYIKPPQEGLYRHYRAVAEAVDIPQILYNVPGRTGCDMQPETVGRLTEIPNIVGIKEAKGDLDRIRKLLALRPAGFAIYSGDDATARESMLLGGDGDISVTANVAPRLMSQMCAAAIAADAETANALDAKLAKLHQALFLEPNPIPAKWALEQMGRIGPGIRLPLVPFEAKYQAQVREALNAAGVLA